MELTLSELATRLGGELRGKGDTLVRGLAAIEFAQADEVTFLANQRYLKHVSTTAAAAVIVPADYEGPGRSLIRCQDPYFAFREAMVIFHGFRQPHFDGIDPLANVAPTARLAEGVRAAAFVTVADGAIVGPRTVLYPGVYIGPNCRLGADCTLHPNVTLYDGTILHDRVTIHAGSSIGHDGFGYSTHRGAHHKIPQAGYVELEDDVEIGACCAIDRATMGPTVVGAGTKFSNLVAIGHGTRLGKHCLLVAQTGLAGSVVVGNYCVFGGQSGVAGHLRIGDGARIAGRTGVTKDVAPGEELFGMPALPLMQAKRVFTLLGRLPQLRATVRKMAREVASIQKRMGWKVDDSLGEGI